MYESQIDGRMIDGLMPFQDKYIGNKYINIYDQYCKGDISVVKDMYNTGLNLQLKLEKIKTYDKCNGLTSKSDPVQVCKNLFSNQFIFWSKSDIEKSCDSIDKSKINSDVCAGINEFIFGKYQEAQGKTL